MSVPDTCADSSACSPAEVVYPNLNALMHKTVRAHNQTVTLDSSAVNALLPQTTWTPQRDDIPSLRASGPATTSHTHGPSQSAPGGTSVVQLDSYLEQVFGGVFNVMSFGTRDSHGSFLDAEGFDTRASDVLFFPGSLKDWLPDMQLRVSCPSFAKYDYIAHELVTLSSLDTDVATSMFSQLAWKYNIHPALYDSE
jgi:hypothetical protein